MRNPVHIGLTVSNLFNALGRQRSLDPAADALQKAVTGAYGAAGPLGARLKDALHGLWLGHPLHPALTDLPVGAWITAAALDTFEALGDRKELGPGADAAVGIGLAGAAGAALSGLTDWSATDGAARRAGFVHALLNGTVMLLYLGSLLARRRGDRGAGRALAFSGLGIATVSAWIGGQLVSEKLVGVDHATADPGPAEFTAVLAETQLPEAKPMCVEAQGARVLLVRQGDCIYALAERCAHLGGPLSEGKLKDGSIICPWHGSRYALADGRALNGPTAFPQPTYQVRVRDGQIELRAATDAG